MTCWPLPSDWRRSIQVVCRLHGIKTAQLLGEYRTSELVDARKRAAKLLAWQGLPSTRIARLLNKHHSTVIYYLKGQP